MTDIPEHCDYPECEGPRQYMRDDLRVCNSHKRWDGKPLTTDRDEAESIVIGLKREANYTRSAHQTQLYENAAAEISRLNERVRELTEHLGEAKDHRDALTTRLRDLLTDPLQDPQPIENELRFIAEQRKDRAALNAKDG